MVGASGFNDIHRGIPRVSRTLLAQRLRQLERMGLVIARPASAAGPVDTPSHASGEALTPIVWAMGHWAAEWVFGDPTDEDCDGLSLIWRLHQHAIPAKLPPSRPLSTSCSPARRRRGWLEIDAWRHGVPDDQGHDVDLAVEADTAQMHRWLPARSVPRARGQRRRALLGPSRLARAFPTWFNIGTFSDDVRRARRRDAAAARDRSRLAPSSRTSPLFQPHASASTSSERLDQRDSPVRSPPPSRSCVDWSSTSPPVLRRPSTGRTRSRHSATPTSTRPASA